MQPWKIKLIIEQNGRFFAWYPGVRFMSSNTVSTLLHFPFRWRDFCGHNETGDNAGWHCSGRPPRWPQVRSPDWSECCPSLHWSQATHHSRWQRGERNWHRLVWNYEEWFLFASNLVTVTPWHSMLRIEHQLWYVCAVHKLHSMTCFVHSLAQNLK